MQISINSLETLVYAFSFIIPGVIVDGILSAFIPTKETNVQKTISRYFALSAVNYAVWAVPAIGLYSIGFFASDPSRLVIAWGLLILPGSLVVGVALAGMREKDAAGRVLRWLGLSPIHPVPTAWEWVFRRGCEAWVIVTLKEGSRVGGMYSAQSFASSESAERDLFLERVYEIGQDGRWKQSKKNHGMWIRGDAITCIEFLED